MVKCGARRKVISLEERTQVMWFEEGIIECTTNKKVLTTYK